MRPDKVEAVIPTFGGKSGAKVTKSLATKKELAGSRQREQKILASKTKEESMPRLKSAVLIAIL